MKLDFWKKKKEEKVEPPQVYTEKEHNCIEEHIEQYFGKYTHVMHEIVSPDLHIDLLIFEPTPERNFYIVMTQGMGAHQMNVPKEIKKYKLDRAEIMIMLPPDWEVGDEDERWYWPLRWMKILARLPMEQDTWLGWGHTVPKGEPFAENTELCGMFIVTVPLEEDAQCCVLPDDSEVNFYMAIPIYEDEMEFKVENDAETLLERMNGMDFVVDIHRPSCCAN